MSLHRLEGDSACDKSTSIAGLIVSNYSSRIACSGLRYGKKKRCAQSVRNGYCHSYSKSATSIFKMLKEWQICLTSASLQVSAFPSLMPKMIQLISEKGVFSLLLPYSPVLTGQCRGLQNRVSALLRVIHLAVGRKCLNFSTGSIQFINKYTCIEGTCSEKLYQ